MIKNANAATLSDSDAVQVWRFREEIPAGWDWGRIVREYTETLDFNTGIRRSEGFRAEDGDRETWTTETKIPAESTPERAAHFRRKRAGYVRIG